MQPNSIRTQNQVMQAELKDMAEPSTENLISDIINCENLTGDVIRGNKYIESINSKKNIESFIKKFNLGNADIGTLYCLCSRKIFTHLVAYLTNAFAYDADQGQHKKITYKGIKQALSIILYNININIPKTSNITITDQDVALFLRVCTKFGYLFCRHGYTNSAKDILNEIPPSPYLKDDYYFHNKNMQFHVMDEPLIGIVIKLCSEDKVMSNLLTGSSLNLYSLANSYLLYFLESYNCPDLTKELTNYFIINLAKLTENEHIIDFYKKNIKESSTSIIASYATPQNFNEISENITNVEVWLKVLLQDARQDRIRALLDVIPKQLNEVLEK